MTKFIRITTYVTVTFIAAIIMMVSGAFLYLAPSLPNVDVLSDIQLQTPLRIYSHDGLLLGEFGDKRRTPILYQDVPRDFVNAFLAAEDDRFFEHHGISAKGLARAVVQKLTGSSTQTGGSTITMQVAKNYFLTPERTIIRKIREMFLAIQIEQQLSKEEILELYVNKIFLGHRAYGIAAAAQVYYGKSCSELSLAQIAMIAGLPKAPSAYNPLANPERALKRRNWILLRMLKLGYIDEARYTAAAAEPITAKRHQVAIDLDAPYIAEMARSKTVDLYGEEAYTAGLRVITTIDSRLQNAAQQAVRQGLYEYDQRHGYRGAESHLDEITDETKAAALANIKTIGDLRPALVTEVADKQLTAELADHTIIQIDWQHGLETARTYHSANRTGPKPKSAADIAQTGDLIRVEKLADGHWQLRQIPSAEAALVSLNANNGGILALVGGYDFNKSKFNRVTQAKRQLGSNIKPFIYSAALANGFTPATTINDAPVVIDDAQLESIWRPENDSGRFYGPTRLRQALYKSRNLVSIRILRQLGISTAIEYLSNFGFARERMTKDLTLALGSPVFSPLEVATGYASFANAGYKIEPYLVEEIYDGGGERIYKANPITVCDDACEEALASRETDAETLLAEAEATVTPAPVAAEETTIKLPPMRKAERIMDEKVAFLIDNILHDVIQKGTGRRAQALGRKDIAGKTGTTNGPTDAWFSGYHPNIVTTTWLGFDDNAVLGRGEYGGSAALPIWIAYMQEALKNQPEIIRQPPAGIVSVLIDKETGKRARPGQDNTMFEYVQEELLPTLDASESKTGDTTVDVEELF